MKKLLVSLLFTLFPVLVFAEDGALSFTPPLSDVSVIFLGNIFGIVDGVLNGTGSQIMGTIFGVFNAAVLALGGIVIMYTLIVSTVNTAHEGQMLGQKWSSIWVPVRATLGLALLIPKASGYCLMQVFVMWVVVQGVGAADKVWNAALGYLNRGGVIVQQQIDPITSIMGGGSTIANGAATILYGQVCMGGLQQALILQRQGYLNLKNQKMGPCYGAVSPDMNGFCETPVPDFLGSVNAVTFQTDQQASAPSKASFTMTMPNFPSGTYSSLNGICGTISWDALDTTRLNGITSLNSSNLETAKLSRAIAIQQMYSMLSSIAQVMINNDPQLSPDNSSSNSSSTVASAPVTPTATEQYGVPYSSTGSICKGNQILGDIQANCVSWGSSPGSTTAPLFNGNEFQGAVAAYNAVMLPTLNLLNESSNTTTANQQRAFINKATTQGWMMAGSYFFSLASINSANSTTAVTTGCSINSASPNATGCTVTDEKSGLGASNFSTQTLSDAFSDKNCSGVLCTWFNKNPERVNQVISLLNGSPMVNLTAPAIPTSAVSGTLNLTPVTGAGASTTYGFVNNSLMVVLPGQPGTAPPKFAMRLVPDLGRPNISLPTLNFDCGEVKIIWPFKFCLIRFVAQAIYNDVFVPMFNYFLNIVTSVINTIVMAFMALPLLGMAQIFQYGLSYITQPNVNPIVGLASMGVNYINFAADLWIYLTGIGIMAVFLGPFGLVILVIMGMTMPLLLAWMGVMVGVGFTTAYFIPFLPYMIFTFGSIAWLMAVIEAMVAAPIVALGITHPEGEGPFGKGEQAIMILMNVFLRPALMIIGYIAGIILSYVGIWVINAGFSNVLPFIQGSGGSVVDSADLFTEMNNSFQGIDPTWEDAPIQMTSGYTGWAAVYGFFFSILVYTTMYLTVVQKSFTLITSLPDKVLRWIGGQQETIGGDSVQWSEDGKQKIDAAGKDTTKAQGQIGEKLGGYAEKGMQELTGSGPSVKGSGME